MTIRNTANPSSLPSTDVIGVRNYAFFGAPDRVDILGDYYILFKHDNQKIYDSAFENDAYAHRAIEYNEESFDRLIKNLLKKQKTIASLKNNQQPIGFRS